jgi:hypothetical protein
MTKEVLSLPKHYNATGEGFVHKALGLAAHAEWKRIIRAIERLGASAGAAPPREGD